VLDLFVAHRAHYPFPLCHSVESKRMPAVNRGSCPTPNEREKCMHKTVVHLALGVFASYCIPTLSPPFLFHSFRTTACKAVPSTHWDSHHLQAAVRLCDMSRDNVVHIAPVGSSTHLTLTSPIPFFPGDRFPTFNMPYNPRVVYIWPWWRQVIYGRCIVKRTFPHALIISTRFSLRFVPHCAKTSFNTHPLLW